MINAMGQLEIPLYHGTSDYFLGNIRKYGLGGYRDSNLFDEDILSELASKLSDARNSTEWWQKNSFIVSPMLKQRITNGGFNFRYGGTYLTPARSTACRYAANNRLGSEFLNTIYEAHTALASVNPSEAERIVPNNHVLMAAFREDWNPVVIVLNAVNYKLLRTEKGEPVIDQLNLMASMQGSSAGLDPEILWQQLNFELVFPIEWDLLEVAAISK